MKKFITFAIVLVTNIIFVGTTFAATTASLTPSNASPKVGQTFTVNIAVNSHGSANYAEKIEVKYPAAILEVRSFALDSAWMALNQPGYDLVDNTNGVIIKSGGYPAGFTAPVAFGTITFYAKTAGAANITIGSNSSAFDANGAQTAVTGSAVAVSVGTVVTTPAQTVTPTPAKTTPTKTTTTDAGKTSTGSESVDSSSLVAQANQAASNSGSSMMWVYILGAIAIRGGITYFIVKRKK